MNTANGAKPACISIITSRSQVIIIVFVKPAQNRGASRIVYTKDLTLPSYLFYILATLDERPKFHFTLNQHTLSGVFHAIVPNLKFKLLLYDLVVYPLSRRCSRDCAH